jgi:hypothetical protein
MPRKDAGAKLLLDRFEIGLPGSQSETELHLGQANENDAAQEAFPESLVRNRNRVTGAILQDDGFLFFGDQSLFALNNSRVP